MRDYRYIGRYESDTQLPLYGQQNHECVTYTLSVHLSDQLNK